MRSCWLVVALAACSSAPGAPDLTMPDLPSVDLPITAADRDGDGLSDADEATLAADHLPYLSLASLEACPESGLVVRVTPEAKNVRILYAWLFNRSCDVAITDGGGGVISLLVDARTGALVSLRTIARPDTSCLRVSTCGGCSGQIACDVLGGNPAVWASKNRHGLYVNRALRCTQTGACASQCDDAAQATVPPLVNIGEPQAKLVHDLTSFGFIQPQNGWTSASLQHYDPWGGLPFGNGPSVTTMLSGADTETPACPQ